MRKIRRVDGKSRRMYYIDGKGYPSVTTITGLLNKPALYNWYAKITAEYLRGLVLEAIADPSIDAFDFLKELTTDKIIKAAKAQPGKIKEAAAQKGKKVHKAIEDYFKTGMVKIGDDIKPQIEKFFSWRYERKLSPIASEHIVYSQKYKYAGTLDLVAKLSFNEHPLPHIYVIDFKTSNGIWPEHKLQLAAYMIAYEEMSGKEIDEGGILRIDKESGETEWHGFSKEELLDYFEEFRRLCEIWHLRQGRKK